MHATEQLREAPAGSVDRLAFIYRYWLEPGEKITRRAVTEWCARNGSLCSECGFSSMQAAADELWSALQ